MAGIDDAIREFTALAKQHDARVAAATAVPEGGIPSPLMTHQVGTSVLDLVTGLQGVVVGGQRENVIIPAAE